MSDRLLPALRGITGAISKSENNRPETSGASKREVKDRVQQLYNNLASNIAVSEVDRGAGETADCSSWVGMIAEKLSNLAEQLKATAGEFEVFSTGAHEGFPAFYQKVVLCPCVAVRSRMTLHPSVPWLPARSLPGM